MSSLTKPVNIFFVMHTKCFCKINIDSDSYYKRRQNKIKWENNFGNYLTRETIIWSF